MSKSLLPTYCIFDGLQWDSSRGLGRFARQLRKHVELMGWHALPFRVPRWKSAIGKVLINEFIEPYLREALVPTVAFYPHNVLPSLFLSHRSVRVLVLHDLLFLDGKQPSLGNRYRSSKLRNSLSRADLIITVSESSRAEILKQLDRECPVLVISNALAEQFEAIAVVNKPKMPEPFRILHFGGTAPTKNTRNVLHAVALLIDRGNNVHLELAAMFSKREIVEKWRSEVNLPTEALTILPCLSDDRLLEVYARVNAHCMPSTGEGFGIPVIEAARTGTPNVLSSLPVFREIIGADAEFADSSEAEAIAKAIQMCIYSDTHRMTMKARQRSEKFLFRAVHETQAVPALQAVAALAAARAGGRAR